MVIDAGTRPNRSGFLYHDERRCASVIERNGITIVDLPNGDQVTISKCHVRSKDYLVGLRKLGISIILRAIVDKKLYTEELESLPASRIKRIRNLERELAIIDEFFESPEFEFWCGSSESAELIRNGMDTVPIERVLKGYENIVGGFANV